MSDRLRERYHGRERRWPPASPRPALDNGSDGTVGTAQGPPDRSPRLPPARSPAFAGCVLTASELQILRQLADGMSYASAALQTRRSVSTVRSLLHTAYARLGVTTIAQALAVCTQIGWLDEVPNEGALVELADRRVTWAQRLYLEAFDQSLRAGDDAAEGRRTRELRTAALTGVYREAGRAVPSPRAMNDPWSALRGTSCA